MGFIERTPLLGGDVSGSAEVNRRLWADRVAEKLEDVVRDPDLNLAVGAYLRQLIIPGLVEQKKLTPEQGDRILRAASEATAAMNKGGI